MIGMKDHAKGRPVDIPVRSDFAATPTLSPVPTIAAPTIVSWRNVPTQAAIRKGAHSLLPRVDFYATGWQTALKRYPEVQSQPVEWQVVPPKVVSLEVTTPEIKVIGFRFPESATWKWFEGCEANRDGAAEASGRERIKPQIGKGRHATRMTAPRDIIKLEDRLYYLLQPPLESWLPEPL